MRNITYNLIIVLLLLVQYSEAQKKFVLEGTLIGFEDSTKLIINPYLSNMAIDMDNETSIYLLKSKFKLEGDFKSPTKLSLRVVPKDFNNFRDFEYTDFWVENKPMILEGKKGAVMSSKIEGSVVQTQYGKYKADIAPLWKQRYQIRDSFIIYKDLSIEKKSEMKRRDNFYDEEIKRKSFDFIFNHPDYYSASAEMVFYITYPEIKSLNKNKVVQFYNELSEEYKYNLYGKQIKSFIDKNEVAFNELKIGDKPYLFTLPDSSGINLELASLKGKIILLDFWASNCSPCRQEHKNYLEVYQKFQSKGFEILSVSQDQSKKYWLKAMQKDNMIWKSVWDANRDVTKMYHISGIPANYLINTDGIIIDKDLREEKLLKKIEELFSGK